MKRLNEVPLRSDDREKIDLFCGYSFKLVSTFSKSYISSTKWTAKDGEKSEEKSIFTNYNKNNLLIIKVTQFLD